MATNHYSNDSICTTTFTPLEYPVQILERVRHVNTIICPSTTSTKSFIMVKVVQQLAYNMRSLNGQRAVYVVHPSNVEVIYELLTSLTDLKVKSVENHHIAVDDWNKIIENNIVLLMTAKSCANLIKSDMLKLNKLNLLFFDDGTYNEQCNFITVIMNEYRKLEKKPRIIALVSGLLCENLVPYYLRGEIDILEKLLNCRLDTSCELTNLVRMSSKPKELLVLCKNSEPTLSEISKLISDLEEFVKEHRYDPTEIYEQEFLEEFRNVPDPKLTPLKLINQFKHIFKEYGVWCANQAALQVLITIDKLKVKVAYERHYLLLCLLQTCMVGVRALCEEIVENQPIFDTIKAHSHGKILRLIEVLKEIGPEYRPEEEVATAPPPPPDPVPPTRFGKRAYKGQRRVYHPQSEDSVSVLIFVQNTTVAKVFHSLLSNIASNDPLLSWIAPLYIADKTANPQTETREAEGEHRKQEEVLRKFRAHECTVLIATPVLEQGYDLPKCNLVVRMDAPNSFQSYIYSKSRARTVPSFYITMAYENTKSSILKQHAEFMAVEKVLLQHSPRTEPNLENIEGADEYCSTFAPYTTVQNENVHLNTAIHLINRYCAKLPSDTFTKLVPTFSLHEDNKQARIHLRLPINSPVKLTIVTDCYDNMAVAMRFAAFYMCQALHRFNELDDFLNPISKEHFKPADEDWNEINMEKEEEDVNYDNIDQRPGTTKRRQYYYKRIAHALKQCRPLPFKSSNFYSIVMTLTCPIPEEQNTRGRRIYPPEESKQGFGILTSTEIPQICPFPIFTRSGEVQVSLELISDEVELTEDQAYKISEFLNYTFTSVLRLQKYQMVFDPQGAESNFYIIPTITENGITKIDFQFIELIYQHRDVLPESIPDQDRVNYLFNAKQYEDAVVMPWYRNQDQPQYFYVAEICCNLNPSSSFPGSEYSTFDEYYNRKYGIKIQNKEQYLLDVDHTSARLNFLTPRYVNRKGVALPTSSEETKRAKRENLEQKQILIPELCAIHPFPASLWRKAVCLPCVLYRINALLLADEIRRTVAIDIQLGKTDLPRSFKWDSLNFGWNLSDVLKKSKIADKHKNDTNEVTTEKLELEIEELTIEEVVNDENEEIIENEDKNWVEIGTWSNDMVEDPNSSKTSIRYGSPTSWLHSTYGYNEYDDFSDTETYYSSDEEATVGSQCGGLHIEFQGDYLAEAVDTKKTGKNLTDLQLPKWISQGQFNDNYCTEFNKVVEQNSRYLEETAVIQPEDKFIKDLYTESPYKCKDRKGDLVVPDYKFKLPETKPANISNVIHATVNGFSFDKQPDLLQHPGPSPNVILQALTMSNANDGINLERLETIGDSFLKYAITDYLYSKYPNTHEGKLSHLRSKQVSNLNLYRLGKKKSLGELMIATKFDPHDNWLPPGYCVSKQLEEALSRAKIPMNYLTLADYIARRSMTEEELCLKIQEEGECINDLVSGMIPYNLVTQHSIPDKSIADCVEALIGAYLIDCGPRGALLFMAWLGIRVLPKLDDNSYGYLPIPYSPLLYDRSLQLPEPLANPNVQLNKLLDGYDTFENILGYNFNDRSYLLQALTHASYYENVITDCYQRLEFLGDAVLDYLITRHLYEDERMHSPGALTDLRSALVNNTIFASLAVKFNFHKYFLYLSPGLHHVIEKFIRIQEEVGHKVSEELFLLDVEENDEVEDVEVPKVLGDIFESVAGAIFLDSGRSLDAVWNVYYGMMKNEIEQFSDKVPKSPIRELLELEPETAKFGPAEKLADGRRVRVAVEVFGKGVFRGIGRNYRIAKCTAAKCALKHLKRQCARF